MACESDDENNGMKLLQENEKNGTASPNHTKSASQSPTGNRDYSRSPSRESGHNSGDEQMDVPESSPIVDKVYKESDDEEKTSLKNNGKSRSRSSSRDRDIKKSTYRSHSRSRSPIRSRSRSSSRKRRRSRTPRRSHSRSRRESPRRRSRRSRSRGRRSRSRSVTPVDGARLHVAELDVETRKRDLEKLFESYGRLREIWMARNPPCFAFVVFQRQKDADRALRETDGIAVGHCRIKVTQARPRVRGGRFRGGGGFDPNLRCYQCGELGHFSRNCTDTKFGYKRPSTPPGGRSAGRNTGGASRRRSRSNSRSRRSRS